MFKDPVIKQPGFHEMSQDRWFKATLFYPQTLGWSRAFTTFENSGRVNSPSPKRSRKRRIARRFLNGMFGDFQPFPTVDGWNLAKYLGCMKPYK